MVMFLSEAQHLYLVEVLGVDPASYRASYRTSAVGAVAGAVGAVAGVVAGVDSGAGLGFGFGSASSAGAGAETLVGGLSGARSAAVAPVQGAVAPVAPEQGAALAPGQATAYSDEVAPMHSAVLAPIQSAVVITSPLGEEGRELLSKILKAARLHDYVHFEDLNVREAKVNLRARHWLRFAPGQPCERIETGDGFQWNFPAVEDMLGQSESVLNLKRSVWNLIQQMGV